MRAIGRLPVILYFINGPLPTKSEAEEAANVSGATVKFRNAALVDTTGAEALEECDGVMGSVPPRYDAAFGSKAGKVSGIGALRMVHGKEPGVTDGQPLHLDSTSTGNPVEEERRRAARGFSINEDAARSQWPNAEITKTRPDDSPAGATGGPSAVDPVRPVGIPGAARVSTAGLASNGGTAPGWGLPVNAGDGTGQPAEDANARAAGVDPAASAEGGKPAPKPSKPAKPE
jgi:hypothetical protein